MYAVEKNVNLVWPLGVDSVCNFIAWATGEKKLKASTVKSYLSSLNFYHQLRGWGFQASSNTIVKAMLRGASNLELYRGLAKPAKKVMTLALLKILGHQISKLDWSARDKQVVWAAFTVSSILWFIQIW